MQKQKQTIRVTLRFSSEDFAALEKLATKHRLAVGDVARIGVIDYLRRGKLLPEQQDK